LFSIITTNTWSNVGTVEAGTARVGADTVVFRVRESPSASPSFCVPVIVKSTLTLIVRVCAGTAVVVVLDSSSVVLPRLAGVTGPITLVPSDAPEALR
jgi:hypothetical protein